MSRRPDSLDTIAGRYGTDKAAGDRLQGYSLVYPRYLEPRRREPLVLLELGVLRGASLLMWADYLPAATIIGVDHDLGDCSIEHARVRVFELEQTNTAGLDAIAASVGGLDVVIDDCSHEAAKAATSYVALWPHVRPGGLYVVEDVKLTRWAPAGARHHDVGLGLAVKQRS